MGRGGYVCVNNATPYTLTKTHIHSYQMKDWSFPDTIAPHTKPDLYVEFSEGIFQTMSDDSGEVGYQIGDTGKAFTLSVSAKNNQRALAVDWQNTIRDTDFVCRPANGHLGWAHDGVVSFTIEYSPGSMPQSQDLENTLANWMNLYSDVLAPLKISELSVPGTHDSGTYDMVSVFANPLTQTQSLSLYQQLMKGARALDLRVGYQSDKEGDERYILCHDTWRSRTTLSDALKQVKAFVDSHPKEIVILDFHRVNDIVGQHGASRCRRSWWNECTISCMICWFDMSLLTNLCKKSGKTQIVVLLQLWAGHQAGLTRGGFGRVWRNSGTTRIIYRRSGKALSTPCRVHHMRVYGLSARF